MRSKLLLILLLVSFSACNTDRKETIIEKEDNVTFDKTKWGIKEGVDYPFRDQMVNDVVYNDTIRTLNKAEILELLGQPTRTNEEYFYYRISQKRIGLMPLTTKTMVIKFRNGDKIEWIKIHGGKKENSAIEKLISWVQWSQNFTS